MQTTVPRTHARELVAPVTPSTSRSSIARLFGAAHRAPARPSITLDTFTWFAPLDRAALLGTWHVQLTTFPMWLSGTKLRPTLSYAERPGDRHLDDLVEYATPSGARRRIAGVDVQDPENTAHFTWRGKGWLAPLRSDWGVCFLDEVAGVAAIAFTRTPFTPAGLDVVTRAADATDADLAPALAELADLAPLAAFVPDLRRAAR